MEEGLHEIAEIDIFGDVALVRRLAWEPWLVVAAGGCILAFACAASGTGFSGGLPAFALSLALLVASFAVHELVHGLFFKIFGGRACHVSYGAKAGMLYTRSSGCRLPKGQFIVVLMAPTVVVSVLFAWAGMALMMEADLAVCAILHLSGCVGDWEMVRAIVSTPGVTMVEDTECGVRLLG